MKRPLPGYGRLLLAAAVLSVGSAPAPAAAPPRQILLWPDGAPGALGDQPTDKPCLTVFMPPQRPAVPIPAVLIIPGGGYKHISSHGPTDARFLNRLGIAGFVLKYRLPVHGYRHPHPLHDAQRAMRIIRAHAAEWAIDPHRIGVMGTSSGGHLASTLLTHFDAGDPHADDPLQHASCRPDFGILLSAVITFKQNAHVPSRLRLLGDNPPPELVDDLSNELQVNARTPPCFLFHADDDTLVPPDSSFRFYIALHRAGVPAELHIFQTGGHGARGAGPDQPSSAWWRLCENWLKANKLVADTPPPTSDEKDRADK